MSGVERGSHPPQSTKNQAATSCSYFYFWSFSEPDISLRVSQSPAGAAVCPVLPQRSGAKPGELGWARDPGTAVTRGLLILWAQREASSVCVKCCLLHFISPSPLPKPLLCGFRRARSDRTQVRKLGIRGVMSKPKSNPSLPTHQQGSVRSHVDRSGTVLSPSLDAVKADYGPSKGSGRVLMHREPSSVEIHRIEVLHRAFCYFSEMDSCYVSTDTQYTLGFNGKRIA